MENAIMKIGVCLEREGREMEGESYPNIEPDESHAQLIVPATWTRGEVEILKAIVESLGNRIVEMDAISSSWIRIKLQDPDMRQVALKLTEKGFFQFRGINALSMVKGSGGGLRRGSLGRSSRARRKGSR